MQISTDVLTVLSLAEIDGPYVRIKEQLERKLYLKVNQVLEACGGNWQRKVKAHLFDGDASARLEAIINSGEVTTKQDIGFFPTPAPLARQLVEMADVQGGHSALEPSAGRGALIEAILARGACVTAIERDQKMRDSLIGRRQATHDWTEAVSIDWLCDDFLDYAPDEPFDRVVMNPPFGKVGRGDHLDHVRHAFSMLVPGGVLVSVLPQGMLFRQDRRHREFREWADDTLGIAPANTHALPDDSFKASGTSVRTCVLRMVHR